MITDQDNPAVARGIEIEQAARRGEDLSRWRNDPSSTNRYTVARWDRVLGRDTAWAHSDSCADVRAVAVRDFSDAARQAHMRRMNVQR